MYQAPVDDMKFVLRHLVGLDRVAALDGYDMVSEDLVDAVQCRHPVQPDKMAKYEFHVVNRCLIHCSISR